MGDVPRCTWGALTGQTFRLHAFWSTSASKTGFRQNFGPVKSAFDRPFAQTLVHFAFLRFRAIGRSTEPSIRYGKLLLVNRPLQNREKWPEFELFCTWRDPSTTAGLLP